jgi:hypothetical protein
MVEIAATIFVVAAAGFALYVVGVGVGSFFVMLEEGMQPESTFERQAREARLRADRAEKWRATLLVIQFGLLTAIVMEIISLVGPLISAACFACER